MSTTAPKLPDENIIKLDGSDEARDKQYEQYRNSLRWKKLRRARMLRAKNRCEICFRADGRELAHLTYERIYRELLDDVLWVCRWCHAALDERPRESESPLF